MASRVVRSNPEEAWGNFTMVVVLDLKSKRRGERKLYYYPVVDW